MHVLIAAIVEANDKIDVLNQGKKVFDDLVDRSDFDYYRIDFENSVRFFRYCCYCIGAYSGPHVFLYDEDGDGIRDCTELKHFLEKKGEQKLWIVPADAHF